jgi:membrane protein YdbS with pleckstrin-like domain
MPREAGMEHGSEDGRPLTDAEIFAIERPHPNLLWMYALASLATLIAAPIVFVPLFFKYHTLRYKFDQEGVSVRWGILFRREIYLTYKRIQDIHVKRNIIERWLGIGTVEIQTAAGSSSAEMSLEGMEYYAAVRDYLYRRMRGFAKGRPAGAEAPAFHPAGAEAPAFHPPGAEAPAFHPAGAGAAAPAHPAGFVADGEHELVRLLEEIRAELEGTRRALAERDA